MTLNSLDKLREWSHRDDCRWVSEDGEKVIVSTSSHPPMAVEGCVNVGAALRELADEIEDEFALYDVSGYPKPFDTSNALHMVLGTAADRFDTPEEAVYYLRGDTSMPLPLDADGVPIHLGDLLVRGDNDKHFCRGIGKPSLDVMDEHCNWWRSECFHHVKHRTLEDVLREYAGDYRSVIDAFEEGAEDGPSPSELTARYAAEIRKLMGGTE